MKKERTYRTLHHFSLGERFDETMTNVYHSGCQYIIPLNRQFIGFSSATSLSNKRTEGNATIRRQVGHPTNLLSDQPTREGVSYQ